LGVPGWGWEAGLGILALHCHFGDKEIKEG